MCVSTLRVGTRGGAVASRLLWCRMIEGENAIGPAKEHHPMTYPTSGRGSVLIIGLIAFLFQIEIVHAGRMPLNQEEQARVNRAIGGGVTYLKRSQGKQGGWAGEWEIHTAGYAALPALTLLECGVSAEEPAIRRAAAIVRREMPRVAFTYEIALSILFLDRLGDTQDHELIQTLAVRLIAGQQETGGWSYKCPFVSKKTQEEILAVLRKLDPPETLDPIAAKGAEAVNKPAVRRKPASPLQESIISRPAAPAKGTTDDKPAVPLREIAPPELPKPVPAKAKPVAKQENKAAEHPQEVPASLKKLPVFRDPDRILKLLSKGRPFIITDNSNTQFAMLALWAARRHEVPAQRSMRMIVRRFESSQNRDGSWSYRYRYGGSEPEGPAMTCVGLLGLAAGHGIDGKLPDSKRIRAGLTVLSQKVGKPAGKWRNVPLTDLYFLWSLERVAVLYRLATVGENDWYRWAAEMLLANQHKSGCWTGGGYPKSSSTLDTCFALLVLKRANFFADLAAKMNFRSEDWKQAIIPASSSRSPGESRSPGRP